MDQVNYKSNLRQLQFQQFHSFENIVSILLDGLNAAKISPEESALPKNYSLKMLNDACNKMLDGRTKIFENIKMMLDTTISIGKDIYNDQLSDNVVIKCIMNDSKLSEGFSTEKLAEAFEKYYFDSEFNQEKLNELNSSPPRYLKVAVEENHKLMLYLSNEKLEKVFENKNFIKKFAPSFFNKQDLSSALKSNPGIIEIFSFKEMEKIIKQDVAIIAHVSDQESLKKLIKKNKDFLEGMSSNQLKNFLESDPKFHKNISRGQWKNILAKHPELHKYLSETLQNDIDFLYGSICINHKVLDSVTKRSAYQVLEKYFAFKWEDFIKKTRDIEFKKNGLFDSTNLTCIVTQDNLINDYFVESDEDENVKNKTEFFAYQMVKGEEGKEWEKEKIVIFNLKGLAKWWLASRTLDDMQRGEFVFSRLISMDHLIEDVKNKINNG